MDSIKDQAVEILFGLAAIVVVAGIILGIYLGNVFSTVTVSGTITRPVIEESFNTAVMFATWGSSIITGVLIFGFSCLLDSVQKIQTTLNSQKET